MTEREQDGSENRMTDAWRDIETAPKQPVPGQLGICVATPDGLRWQFNHAWWDDAVEEWIDVRSDCYLRPTHWMPLPEPPQ